MRTLCRTLAVSVGVTGHRTIRPEMRLHIEGQVEQILRQIKIATADPKEYWDQFEGETVLRVVSCLADGADRLVAEVASCEKRALGYELEAVIPFPRESLVHECDRTGEEREAAMNDFINLLNRAVRVLELDPDYSGDPWDAPTGIAERHEAYERAGLRMLDYSDLLIAVWNGRPQDRRGSTYDIISRAEKMRIPVLWIHSEQKCDPVLLYRGEDAPMPVAHSLADMPMENILKRLFSNPAQDKTNNVSLDDFIREDLDTKKSPLAVLLSRVWPVFFRIVAPSKIRGTEFSASNDITPYYEDVDKLASYYANRYRSSFLLNCFFGALAITFAAVGLAYKPAYPLLLAALEGACLVFVFANYVYSRRRRWQQRLTLYRYLAEQIRHFEVLRPLGWVIPDIHATLHYDTNEAARWIRWYLRNIVRKFGMPGHDLSRGGALDDSKNALAEGWIQSQIDYHQNSYHRYRRFEHLTHGVTNCLFGLVAVALAAHVGCKFCDVHPKGLGAFLGLLTIVAPTWAMAAHALGQYAEARRLSDRSKAMQKLLGELKIKMLHAGRITEVDRIARETAYLMLQETADWHIQYQMTTLSPA